MMLIIHFTNDHYRMGLLVGRTAKWYEDGPVTGRYSLLSRLIKVCERAGKFPRAVAVTLHVRRSAAPRPNVSWSTVRAAVAMANTLAFAWNVKVVEVPISGQEDDKSLIALAKQAALAGKKGTWVKAKYSGEPNITKAKALI